MPGGQFPPASLPIIGQLLGDDTDESRGKALADLETLPDVDKDATSSALVSMLGTEADGRKRCWIISALGALDRQGALIPVASRLDHQTEPSEWVRYRAVLALARMGPPDLDQRLAPVRNDVSEWVRAIVLRVLAAKGLDQPSALVRLIGEPWWVNRFAACRVLQHDPLAPEGLPAQVEHEVIPALAARLSDGAEYPEVQRQAALALGDMKQHWGEAIQRLKEVFELNAKNEVKLASIEALSRMGRQETQTALLLSLKNPGNEETGFSARAAKALEQSLGTSAAVSLLVEQVLRLDVGPTGYIEALRLLQRETAARLLTVKLLDPDQQVRERAARVLASLGTEEVFRTFHHERIRALARDATKLDEADKEVLGSYKRMIVRAMAAATMSLFLHGILFALTVATLFGGFALAVYTGDLFIRWLSVGIGISGLIGLFLLVFFHPLKTFRSSMNSMVRVSILLLSQLRLLAQTDALLRHAILSADLSSEQAKELANQTRASVKEMLEQLEYNL